MAPRILLLVLLTALLSACGIPVPPEKANYIGEWQDKTMYLLITEDGSVRYNRLKQGATIKINGPLKEFQGDNFVVGIGWFASTFTVNRPPYEEDGRWKMVVEGVSLTRTVE